MATRRKPPAAPPGPPPTTRAGFAVLLGRPNVGKSTLLNALVGERLAIVSPKPQTTRSRIVGVVSRPEGQVALVDTPGLHQAKGALNRFMVDQALTAAAEGDLCLFLVEADGQKAELKPQVSEGNRFVLERLKALGKPAFLVITKIDRVSKALLLPLIDRYRTELPFLQVVPVSARTGDGLEVLLKLLLEALPPGAPMFPADVFTDQQERALVGELIREQVLQLTFDEVPYATAVTVEVFDESERFAPPPRPARARQRTGLARIHAGIHVERDSQKAIIIGKQGQMLKTIGTRARKAIEALLDCNVFLSLQVRVEPGWSERPQGLRKLGYDRG